MYEFKITWYGILTLLVVYRISKYIDTFEYVRVLLNTE